MVAQTKDSALVAGRKRGPASDPEKTVSIRVLRGFLYQGKPQEAGTELNDVPRGLAAELVQMTKAEFVKPLTLPEEEVVRDEAAATARESSRRKEKAT
jgi:hypothetical protein